MTRRSLGDLSAHGLVVLFALLGISGCATVKQPTNVATLKPAGPRWHAGSCHCGRVRFEVRMAPDAALLDCNCSMCRRSAYLHLIVGAADFRLLAGAEDLTEYTFGTGVAKHRFCRRCGVASFYEPRSDPDKIDVNLRCVEGAPLASVEIREFDGRDWEAAHRRSRGPT